MCRGEVSSLTEAEIQPFDRFFGFILEPRPRLTTFPFPWQHKDGAHETRITRLRDGSPKGEERE